MDNTSYLSVFRLVVFLRCFRSLTGLRKPRRSVPVLPHIGFEKPYPSKQTSYNEADQTPKFSVSSFFYKEKVN